MERPRHAVFHPRGAVAPVLHFLFGHSWDSAGQFFGMELTTDGVHLNDRAAAVHARLVGGWLAEVLPPTDA